MLDGIRSGRTLSLGREVQGPRWREFSLGDKEGQCFLWLRAKNREPDQTMWWERKEQVALVFSGKEEEPSLTSL